jgi:secretion/DNA translocation related CpaE-like protein
MTTAPPLLITRDDDLAGDVLRLAAAAGVTLEVVAGPETGMRGWGSAAAVLVGADQAAATVAAGPPRRDQVHVVSLGVCPDALFRAAVDIGACSVLELPDADTWLVELLTDIGDGDRAAATTVAVVGGSGGVGATVLAGSLALTAGGLGRALLVDLDPLGPGMRRVVGLDDVAGVSWRELAGLQGRLGSRALRDALPGRDGVAVLGWPDDLADPPSGTLVREVVLAGQRGHDWVVLDLPRTADPLLTTVVAHCDHVVLLVGSTLGAVASAARVAERLAVHAPTLGLVVRARRGAPMASEVARALGVPLLAELPDQRRLDEHLDLGLGPVRSSRGALARTSAELVRGLGARAPHGRPAASPGSPGSPGTSRGGRR